MTESKAFAECNSEIHIVGAKGPLLTTNKIRVNFGDDGLKERIFAATRAWADISQQAGPSRNMQPLQISSKGSIWLTL